MKKVISEILKRIDNLLDLLSESKLSRFLVYLLDLQLVVISLVTLFIIDDNWEQSKEIFVLTILFYVIAFLIVRPYEYILRQISMVGILKVIYSVLLAIVFYFIFRACSQLFDYQVHYSAKDFIFVSMLSAILMIVYRYMVKMISMGVANKGKKGDDNIIIYGADSIGAYLLGSVVRNDDSYSNVVSFIEDDKSRIGKKCENVTVREVEAVLNDDFIRRNSVSTLIFSEPPVSEAEKKVLRKALDLGLSVKMFPKIDWTKGKLKMSRLENVKIELLLNRDPIMIDEREVSETIDNKVVMVSGAVGSIGSELVRQVIKLNPRMVVAVDYSETGMFDFRFDLMNDDELKNYALRVKFEVADVRDPLLMGQIFEKYHPQIFIHAAAYKHVPIMEASPYNAVVTNVLGTVNVATLSMEYGVEKFLMISTDKAVNPSSVMGASKRMAEIYVQSRQSQTKFITTRFGNVLGSNGSVVRIFQKQINEGKPLTVTDKEVTRFFMTNKEACNLILEALMLGNGGDLFSFDMGKQVNLYRMAQDMLQLSQARNPTIKVVGLRPGEKLKEEILVKEETSYPSKHPKIKHTKSRKYECQVVDCCINELRELTMKNSKEENDYAIVEKLKSFIPEYVSKNSVYEEIDKRLTQKQENGDEE